LAQVMIYAVGITLVVVIALMLTNPRLESEERIGVESQKLPGVIVAVFLFLTIYLSLRSESWPVSNLTVQPENLKVLGYSLMTVYSLPFEFASILLLAALIGAVMLAKAEPERATHTDTRRSDDVVKV
jgi:NADH:ubiquinone oxidoreductase subunit 6 (subunit J)